MNSSKLFYFSLIVLSLVMGIDWYKHKPQIPVKKRFTRTSGEAINLEDIELENDSDSNKKSKINNELAETEEEEEDENEKNNLNKEENTQKNNKENNIKSDDSNSPLPDNANPPPTRHEDPVIASFHSLKRNPFEQSPYEKLIEQIKQKEAEKIAEQNKPPEQVVLPVELRSNYSGSIRTKLGLKAIIDSRLYGIGDEFDNKKILSITNELITLQEGSNKFLIPKKGVRLIIAQDGTYTTEDNFLKKAN